MKTILITCKNDNCERTFRVPEYVRPNSTIKSKLNQECLICKNKALLGKSTLYDKKIKDEPKYPFREKKGQKRTKKNSKSRAMALADSWFSKYIRLNNSFESGGELFCMCYTCGAIKKIKEIENGHWQRRGFKTTRYHHDNCKPQCTKCNGWRSGEPEKFELRLIRDIGQQRVDELKKLSQQIGEDNTIFFKRQAERMRLLTNKLIKEKGINPWRK